MSSNHIELFSKENIVTQLVNNSVSYFFHSLNQWLSDKMIKTEWGIHSLSGVPESNDIFDSDKTNMAENPKN